MTNNPSNYRGHATRNDDSVLFSLANLSKLAPSAPPLQPKPAAAMPAQEGSGLLEIKQIGAMLQREAPARANSPEDRMPSFSGGGLDGLSAAPLASEAPALTPTPTSRPARPNNGPIYAMLGLLSAGLLGLGALIVLDSPLVVTEVVTVAGPAAVQEEPPAPAEPEAALEATPEVEAEPEPEPQVEEKAPERATAPRRRNRTSNQANNTNTVSTTTTTKPTDPPKSTEPDVDCLINPNLDKCRPKSTTPKPEATPKEPKETSEALPNKLDQSAILAGIGPVKTAAKSCGSGTTVEVKFSVEGATGKVLSAEAIGEHASSEVGRCVTKAAAKASFDRFAAKQQGLTFKFRL